MIKPSATMRSGFLANTEEARNNGSFKKRKSHQPRGWSLSMVAFGDRRDFLQVLRVGHFRRKCPTRNTCKRDLQKSGKKNSFFRTDELSARGLASMRGALPSKNAGA